jgi:protein arginine kinase
MPNLFNLVNFTGDLVDFYGARRNKKICANCGFEFENFHETGNFGCSKCYDTFKTDIEKLVQKSKFSNANFGFEKLKFDPKILDNLVVSARVRLARNLEGIPFQTKTKGAFNALGDTVRDKNANFVISPIGTLSREMAHALFEQHLISRELLNNKINGLIVSKTDNKTVIMLGEEDHIRIQNLCSGFDLETAFSAAQKISTDIVTAHSIAWRKDFGFLTSCPTNLGTGMRASVMIFLPALSITGKMEQIAAQLSNQNLTVRGVYGEGSDAKGFMYQISNQACFGMTERQILDMVKSVTVEIATLESKAQQELFKSSPDEIVDGVMRAWGVLTNAYLLPSAEAVENLAMLKLGACLGILKFKNARILDDLFFIIQPQTLVTQDNRLQNVTERDKLRANRVAKELHASRI